MRSYSFWFQRKWKYSPIPFDFKGNENAIIFLLIWNKMKMLPNSIWFERKWKCGQIPLKSKGIWFWFERDQKKLFIREHCNQQADKGAIKKPVHPGLKKNSHRLYETLRKLYFLFLSHWMRYDRGGFSFWFWTKWNYIWFKIKRKTITMIISHSMWKELEILFSLCTCVSRHNGVQN